MVDTTGVRIAAVGDVHAGADDESAARLRAGFTSLADHADVLVLAGDLTRCGHPDEAAVVAGAVARAGVPTAAVLGNHDLHADRAPEVVAVLEGAGVRVLDGASTVVDVGALRVGIAGVNGFGGGFAGACVSVFGEPETKAFARHAVAVADRLGGALDEIGDADVRVALLHYSPVRETLEGEPLEIYPFLGSYLLAEAIDARGADLVVHGHAHRGSERGMTPGGVRVRNVAQPVIRAAYRVFTLQRASEPAGVGASPDRREDTT
ncbi:MAG TPA: metallophosphoesterase [Acidimicrobiales bacterium]|nr:metallophosphoesterase [Acidimicrobiales bacterium]